MLKSIRFGDLERPFSSSRRSDRVYLGWFVWDSVWRLFRMQASRWSVKLSRVLVLLAPLLALGSKSTSLSAGIHMWVQAVRYDLFSSAVFVPYFSMLILSLPLLGLGSKSNSLSPGFCICRPRQYDTICWELNLISGFFAFFWLIVWVDGINKCGWCLAGGRGFWLKGLHQIPSVSWIFHHSLHFHIY